MKSIKINAVVNLNNGLQIPSGSVCVITEGLAQVFATSEGLIPAQIVSNVYTSVSNYESGLTPVDGNSISDFNPAMYGLKLSVANYETKTAEDLLVGAVYDALNLVYPSECEIVNVTPPVTVVTETT